MGTNTIIIRMEDWGGDSGINYRIDLTGFSTTPITVIPADNTAPVLTVPGNVVLQSISPAGAPHTFAASATDAVDPSPVVSCDAVSGATFPLGITTVNCTATDAMGNSSSGSFTITVTNNPPVINVDTSNTVFYTNWLTADLGAGTAHGEITLGTQVIDVDLSTNGGTPLYGAQLEATSTIPSTALHNFWDPHGANPSPYTSTEVPNAPPDEDLIALQGGSQTIYTITFSENGSPVQIVDPIMSIVSLGGGTSITYKFDTAFEIVSQGTAHHGGGSNRLTREDANKTLRGKEGSGTIKFLDTVSSFSWTVPAPETWHAFTFGARTSVAVGNSVIVDEGQLATITGTWSDPDAGDVVTLDETLGTITKNNNGTWDWSYQTTDGPLSQVVTVDAEDLSGGTDDDVFTLIVNNVAPSVTVANTSVTLNEGPTAFNSGTFSDPGLDVVTVSASAGTVTQVGSQSGTWNWSFAPTDGPTDSQTVTITATDSDGASSETTFALVVNNVAPVLETGVVDLNTWTEESFATANWTVAGDANSVFQSVNGDPTFFYSDFNALGSPLSGSIEVTLPPPGGFVDDDFIGFAIGFEPGDTTSATADYLLVDWKKGTQAFAPLGLAVSRVSGVPSATNFWRHTGGVVELARANTLGSTGWSYGVPAQFTFEFTSARLRVFVNGNLEIDITGSFSDGRFAFYNYSQARVTYSAIQSDGISGLEGSSVSLSKDFTDVGIPDTHSATINWGDGTGDLPATVIQGAGFGTVTGIHTYDDNGIYTVTIRVTDDDLDWDEDTLTATIGNVAPVVTASGQVIAENGIATVSGTITDPSPVDTFTMVIDWGGSEGSTTFSLPAGTTGYSETHQYLDDDPTGTASDNYSISVTVTDDDGGVGTAGTTVTVNNVAPTVTAVGGVIDENGTVTVSGTITDPGTQDTFTVVIDWGGSEGSTTSVLSAGATSYSATHQYLDDDPTATASDTYAISVTVTDDDGGVGTAGTTVTVNNVAPTVTAGGGVIDENGTVTVSGTITDPGTLDTFTVVIDWGGSEGSTTSVLSAGATSYSATHQYLDDDPTASLTDTYAVSVTITDDDGGVGTAGTSVTVNNVAPVVTATGGAVIDENGSITVSGSITDPGSQDTFTLVIDWGGSEGTTTVYPVAGATSYSETHQYLDDDPTATASDNYAVSVTITDDDGGVGTAGTSVTVNNVDPEIGAVADFEIFSGETAEFSVGFTDQGTLDIHGATVVWPIGEGIGSTSVAQGSGSGTITATQLYYQPGDYLVTVTVTDDDGGTDSTSFTLTVKRVHIVVDLKPTSTTDPLNLNGNGVVPIAIMGSATFTVSHLERLLPDTARAGTMGDETDETIDSAEAHHNGHFEDVNLDGYMDYVFHFREFELGVPIDTPALTELYIYLTIEDSIGVHYIGRDDVRINPNNGNSKGKRVEGGKGGPKKK